MLIATKKNYSIFAAEKIKHMTENEIYSEICDSAPTTEEFHKMMKEYINLMKCPLTREILIKRAKEISKQMKNVL